HVPRGGEIIAPADVHMISGEAAGHAAVPGGAVRGVPWRDGGTLGLVPLRGILGRAHATLHLVTLRDAFRSDDVHEPATALVTIENTHSLSMGQPLTPAFTRSVAEISAERGVPLFIDGARLFNASVALGVPARDLVPAGS